MRPVWPPLHVRVVTRDTRINNWRSLTRAPVSFHIYIPFLYFLYNRIHDYYHRLDSVHRCHNRKSLFQRHSWIRAVCSLLVSANLHVPSCFSTRYWIYTKRHKIVYVHPSPCSAWLDDRPLPLPPLLQNSSCIDRNMQIRNILYN